MVDSLEKEEIKRGKNEVILIWTPFLGHRNEVFVWLK